MVGQAEHPGFPGAPRPGTHHYLHGHTFAGRDEVGEDDSVDTVETGPFTARLVAGVVVWGLILLVML